MDQSTFTIWARWLALVPLYIAAVVAIDLILSLIWLLVTPQSDDFLGRFFLGLTDAQSYGFATCGGLFVVYKTAPSIKFKAVLVIALLHAALITLGFLGHLYLVYQDAVRTPYDYYSQAGMILGLVAGIRFSAGDWILPDWMRA